PWLVGPIFGRAVVVPVAAGVVIRLGKGRAEHGTGGEAEDTDADVPVTMPVIVAVMMAMVALAVVAVAMPLFPPLVAAADEDDRAAIVYARARGAGRSDGQGSYRQHGCGDHSGDCCS